MHIELSKVDRKFLDAFAFKEHIIDTNSFYRKYPELSRGKISVNNRGKYLEVVIGKSDKALLPSNRIVVLDEWLKRTFPVAEKVREHLCGHEYVRSFLFSAKWACFGYPDNKQIERYRPGHARHVVELGSAVMKTCEKWFTIGHLPMNAVVVILDIRDSDDARFATVVVRSKK